MTRQRDVHVIRCPRAFLMSSMTRMALVSIVLTGTLLARGSGAPDTHLFRVETGKLRYVHTLTHLVQTNFRGLFRRNE
jgi:hypothetical protein